MNSLLKYLSKHFLLSSTSFNDLLKDSNKIDRIKEPISLFTC